MEKQNSEEVSEHTGAKAGLIAEKPLRGQSGHWQTGAHPGCATEGLESSLP